MLDEIILVPVLMENAASSRIHILASHEDFDESNRLEPGQVRPVTVRFVRTEDRRGDVIIAEVFRAGTNDTPTTSQACALTLSILVFLNNTEFDLDNLPPGEVRWEGGALHCGGSIENVLLP